MTRKKTLEQYKEEVKALYDTYEVVGDYINASTNISMRHSCGEVFEVLPYRFLSGVKKCPKCTKVGRKRMTQEDFEKKIFELGNGEYTVLGEYITSHTYVKIRHNKCGYEWDAKPEKFVKGHRCKKCATRKTLEKFREELLEAKGDEYLALERIIEQDKDTKFRVVHNVCGYEYITSVTSPKNLACAKCNGTAKKTHADFVEEVYNLVGDEHVVLDDYVNARRKLEILHNECGKISLITPHAFLNKGTRCQYCKTSKGEKKIRSILEKNSIDFKSQYTFKNCKDINRLRFDFAIFKDEKLEMLIEYDGGQHFKAVDMYGGEEGFKKQLERDRVKNEYCKDNNITLLRIPYYDFDNLEKILEEKVIKLVQ